MNNLSHSNEHGGLMNKSIGPEYPYIISAIGPEVNGKQMWYVHHAGGWALRDAESGDIMTFTYGEAEQVVSWLVFNDFKATPNNSAWQCQYSDTN